jgi:hypothetical protein
MKQAKIMGIDPGAHGGIVWLDADGNVCDITAMPPTPMDILESVRQHGAQGLHCFIEDVGHGLPGQSSKATATFARHVGNLEMALLASGVSATKVTPQKWQKHFNLQSKKGETKSAHKNRIKAMAQQRFPQVKVTLLTADALMIALYGLSQTK